MPAFLRFWEVYMPARIEVAPELIAEGKHLYENTLMPIHKIGAKMGLSRTAFYLRVKEWGWTPRRYSCGEVIETQIAVPEAAAAPMPDEPAEVLPFAQRLQRVLDGELAVIERTLKVMGPANNAEAERTARIFAAISRTVQEIQTTAEGQMSSDDADDDAVPGDIDEFRETLARRLQGFIEARRGHASGRDNGLGADVEDKGT
jgi:hypothetical protein